MSDVESSRNSSARATPRHVRFVLPTPELEGPEKGFGDDWYTGVLQEQPLATQDSIPLTRIATHHPHVRFESYLPKPSPSPVAVAPPVDLMRTIDMRSEGNIAYKVVYDNGLDQDEFEDEDDESQGGDLDNKVLDDDLEDVGVEGSAIKPIVRHWVQALKLLLRRIARVLRLSSEK